MSTKHPWRARQLTLRLLEFGLNRYTKFKRLQHFDMLALPRHDYGEFTHVGERNFQR